MGVPYTRLKFGSHPEYRRASKVGLYNYSVYNVIVEPRHAVTLYAIHTKKYRRRYMRFIHRYRFLGFPEIRALGIYIAYLEIP